MKKFIYVFIAIALSMYTTIFSLPAFANNSVSIRDFELTNMQGETTTIKSLAGKSVILVFGRMGEMLCGNTYFTLKNLNSILTETDDDALCAYFMDIEESNSKEAIAKNMSDMENITACYQALGYNEQAWDLYFTCNNPPAGSISVTLPMVFFIDADGKICDYSDGVLTSEELTNKIDEDFNYTNSSEIVFNNMQELWSKSFWNKGDTAFGILTIIKENVNNEVFVSSASVDNDIILFKLDHNGNIIWNNTYGGSDADYPNAIITLDDGGCIIGGRSYSDDGDVSGNNGKCDYWILRLDKDGNIVWQNSLGDGGCDFIGNVILTNDNNIAFCGMSYGYNGTYATLYKLSLDTGDVLTYRTYEENTGDWVKAVDIIQLSNNNFVIAGETDSYSGIFANRDKVYGDNAVGWIAEVSEEGDILWQEFYTADPSANESSTELADLTRIADNTYMFVASTYNYENKSYTRKVIRMDEKGNIIFEKEMPSYYWMLNECFFAIGDYKNIDYYNIYGSKLQSFRNPDFFKTTHPYLSDSGRLYDVDYNASNGVQIKAFDTNTTRVTFKVTDSLSQPIEDVKIKINNASLNTNSDGLVKIDLKRNNRYTYAIEYDEDIVETGVIDIKKAPVEKNIRIFTPVPNPCFTTSINSGEVRVKNETEKSINAYVIIALYKNNAFKKIEYMTEHSFLPDEEFVYYTHEADMEGYKVFAWNSLEYMLPLAKYNKITEKE